MHGATIKTQYTETIRILHYLDNCLIKKYKKLVYCATVLCIWVLKIKLLVDSTQIKLSVNYTCYRSANSAAWFGLCSLYSSLNITVMSVHKITSWVVRLLSLYSVKGAIIEVWAFLEHDGGFPLSDSPYPNSAVHQVYGFRCLNNGISCGVPQNIRFPQTRSNDDGFLVSPGIIRIAIEGSRLVFL